MMKATFVNCSSRGTVRIHIKISQCGLPQKAESPTVISGLLWHSGQSGTSISTIVRAVGIELA